MRAVFALIGLLGVITEAIPQTLIGNCGAQITGIQLSTGNIYCIPIPKSSSCSLNYSKSCATIYHVGIFQ